MARSQNDSSLGQLVRRIVREEIRSMFSSEDETYEPTMLSSSTSAVRENNAPIRRRRRSKSVKGKVTNPATDRRLKINREANA